MGNEAALSVPTGLAIRRATRNEATAARTNAAAPAISML